MLNSEKEKTKKLQNWNKGKKPGPFNVEIHPTGMCNLKCIMCGAKFNSKVELSKERLHEIIYEAKDLGVEHISITGGGEPLFYNPGILEIIKTVKLLGLEGSLTTNGTLFTQDQIRKIVEIDWDEVIFSLDSADNKTHDYIRGVKGTFRKCTKAIKLFGYWKKKLRKNNPEIKINTVIMNKNYNKLEKIIRLAQKLGCHNISFQILLKLVELAKRLELNGYEKVEFQKSITKIKRYAHELHIHTNLDDFTVDLLVKKSEELYKCLLVNNKGFQRKSLFSAPCFEPWTSMIIPPEGKIGPCPRITEKSPVKVYNSSLRSIWYGKFFDKIRRDILNKRLSGYCENCCSPKVTSNINIKKEYILKINSNIKNVKRSR